MTFQTGCYAVDGNTEDASLLRQMLQGATLGSQGTVGHLDCQVKAHGPPTAGIVVGTGSVIVLGAESPYQGSYYAVNEGDDTTLSIAATGGSPRSDMIIARAEDPTWSGSPWGNPASGQIIFPRVLSGVSSGATTVPGGYSAIPLARIDMPAGVSVVQASYINDLRTVCNPQRIIQVWAVAGPSVSVSSTAGATVVNWPPGAAWQMPVPAWATQAVVSYSVNEAEYNTGSGNGVLRGNLFISIGSSILSPVIATPGSLYSLTAVTGPYRHTFTGAATIAIPASIRGTTQFLEIVQAADGTNTATMNFNEGSSASVLVEFQQIAAAA